MSGLVVAIEDVPDPVFSDAVVGAGLAILPDEPDPSSGGTDRAVVSAPCDGRIVSVYPHAVVIQVDDQRSVLVHLGVGTGALEGRGFDLAVADGDFVTAGHPLIGWSPAAVRAAGGQTLSPVVAMQARPEQVLRLVDDGARVAEGQPILLWA